MFSAFSDLSPSRAVHMGGEGYISAQEVQAYCDLAGITDPEDRIDLFRLVRAMDGVFLREREAQRASQADGTS